jgi:glycosyltransferase involved in cell wall biosynthesis
MRIAQIAPLAESVPPKLYGGTERVVAWLVDELVELGHDVTLFASGDSRTRGRLHAVWPRALRLGRPQPDPSATLAILLDAVSRRARDFDVIHAHIDWLHLPLLTRSKIPFLTTLHGRLDLPGIPEVIRDFPDACFVSISNSQRAPLKNAKWCGTVYHGLPPSLFRPSYEQGSYLAFLGRLTPDKGPQDAIRIARAVGMPLRMAAKVPRAETGYFKKQLEPQIDGRKIELVGELDDRGKQPFLSGAAALLFPIDWPEPFGLVMIEAMACGTPVVAYRAGSVPEVIDEGVTGFIVDSEEDAVRAVKNLKRLDRRKVRARFEERFTAARMARAYEDYYQQLGSASEKAPRTKRSRNYATPIESRPSAKADKALPLILTEMDKPQPSRPEE